uniref:Uncharacterized protein n=1 Tax=Oryza punctata TaxID=4537 RepID=A0A0E0LDJ9_ORYPU
MIFRITPSSGSELSQILSSEVDEK